MKNLFKVLAVIFIVAFPCNAYAKDWGLSFPKGSKTPVGNEKADYLKQYDAYFIGDDSENVIYLTFDAGYESGQTEPILDTLKKNDIKATFFLVGTYIKQNPELIKRMVAEGHIVANHTMKHPDMTKLDSQDFISEIKQVEEIYKEVTGSEMKKYYRPPQGKYDENTLKAAQAEGYKTILWSLAYRDFGDNQPTKEEAFSKLIPRVHPGAIILLHNTSQTNADIMDELLQKYKEMGYSFKTVDQL